MSALVHSVHFYEKDAALIQRLWSLTVSSLREQKSVLLIVTAAHDQAIRRYFSSRGLDIRGLEARGVLCLMEAELVMRRFTSKGRLDRRAFQQVLNELITSASEFSESKRLMAFGEMVAILWERGDRTAALELEKWWNDLLGQRDFHLHCAYPKHLFFGVEGEGAIREVCSHHSIALGAAAA